jgi:lipoprotein-releasing system permease protein
VINDLPFELFIAWRYLLAKRKQAFIALISFISVIGVMVGVMAVLIALALMTGLQGELRARIVGASAHVYVFRVDGITDIPAEVAKLKQVPRVAGVAPAAMGKGMLTAGQDRSAAVTIKGIDPALEVTVTDIRKSMRKGSLDAIRSQPDDMDGIVLGTDLATTLDVQPGDTVRLMSPNQVLTPMGMSQFRVRTFKVVGIFSLGLYEFDSEYALVDLPVAERVFGHDQPQSVFLQVRLDDMFASKEVAEDIPKRLGGEYTTQDWAQMNKSLFSALWLEKMAISITIGLIMTVAAVNIVASLVLLVMEKSRDIAILKTMGTSTASIRRIFMLQGLIIGVAGTLAGVIGGYVLIYLLDRFKVIRVPIDVYQISYIPFTLLATDLLTVVAAALVICFVATIYPSRQASKLDPAQALRYQ